MTDDPTFETIEELQASEEWQQAGVVEKERLRSQWYIDHDEVDPALDSSTRRTNQRLASEERD